MNQRANSVADLAAVLLQGEKGPSKERIEYKEGSRRDWARVRMQKEKAGKEVPKRSPHAAQEAYGVEGVTVRWADILDAEFAETWPEQVVHHTLQRHRYTAAFPAYEIKTERTEEDPAAIVEMPEVAKGGERGASAGTA